MPARGGGGAPLAQALRLPPGWRQSRSGRFGRYRAAGVARFPFKQPVDYGKPGAAHPLIDPAAFVWDHPGQCRRRRRPARARGCSGRWEGRLPQPGRPGGSTLPDHGEPRSPARVYEQASLFPADHVLQLLLVERQIRAFFACKASPWTRTTHSPWPTAPKREQKRKGGAKARLSLICNIYHCVTTTTPPILPDKLLIISLYAMPHGTVD